jgi:hypothetical protein
MEAVPDVWAALGRAGFSVTTSAASDPSCDQDARCCRGDRELVIGLCFEPDGAFLVVAHPPCTWRPWRWGGDIQFFNDLTALLDVFNIPA